MKVYVLTEIDLDHVGFSPNTVQVFPTFEKAIEEMRRMYIKALDRFDTTEDDMMNVFDEGSGYASIGEIDYKLDIFECEFEEQRLQNVTRPTIRAGRLKEILASVPDDKEVVAYDLNDRRINVVGSCACEDRVYLDLGAVTFPSCMTLQEITVVAEGTGVREMLMDGSVKSMSRDKVWELMQEWAKEFDESHKDFDYSAHNTSYYDEIDNFVAAKKRQLDMPELRPDADVEDDIELTDDKLFGEHVVVTAHLHIYDGYAEGDGIRVEFPKLSDLTAAQIEEIDRYVGGRIKDSGYVVPDDVLLKYGKVVSFYGIMDTGNGHHEDLVRRVNVAWVRCKKEFEPIMKALYERDIDGITDHDAFRIPAWEEWPEYHHGCNTSDWGPYNKLALETMKDKWDEYAEDYLMHIADDQDLECILDFVRG